ncbi:MAG: hypothetical protein SGILL_009976, partial [Bacillariaceae sp.]
KHKKRSTVTPESTANLDTSDSDSDSDSGSDDDFLSHPTFQSRKSTGDKGLGNASGATRTLYPPSAVGSGAAAGSNGATSTTRKAPPKSATNASTTSSAARANVPLVTRENRASYHSSMAKLEKEKIAAEIELLREQTTTVRFERKVSMLNQYNKLRGEDKWSHDKIATTFPELIPFFPKRSFSGNTGDKDEGRAAKKARHK